SLGQAADKARIDRALAGGVIYLKKTQQPNGAWSYQHLAPVAIPGPANSLDDRSVGATALAGLALLECGINPNDPAVEKAAAVLREAAITLDYTYGIALVIMFLDRLGDADDVPIIQSLVVRLLAGRNAARGWGGI